MRPNISRIDVDVTELENSQVWSGPPKPAVDFHAARAGHWAEDEHAKFLAGLETFGRRWDRAARRVEIDRRFGWSRPNFRILSLGHIDVDSADFWTHRLLSSSSQSTAEESGAIRSITLTLKSD